MPDVPTARWVRRVRRVRSWRAQFDPWRRLEEVAARSDVRVRGRNPAHLGVRIVRRALEVRVAGLAAEIGYYLVVSLLPLITMLGASFGVLRTVLADATVDRMQDSLTAAMETVFSPRVAGDFAVPLVRQLLEQEQVGLALGSVLAALWLGSRVFRAAVRALGEAYRTPERRNVLELWALGFLFTLAAVVVTAVFLALAVVGPLLGGGFRLADSLGVGPGFQTAWSLGRWPVLVLLVVAFLAWLYQVGHNADTRWRDSLPGAVLATAGLLVLAAVFRQYLEVAGPRSPDLAGGGQALQVVGEFIGSALAVVLFGWLASIVVLAGGVFNAEWQASGAGREQEGAGAGAREPG
ncbi:YihY/virulence factor BrkB family protein [Kineococcus sp. LSe6-4]|uniref:YihY/virulence factor BrkB family protein n=1 Tax=Kineococcus halophytocola TaxID=3234027 RepID=A0ABV4H8D9_9ACTN